MVGWIKKGSLGSLPVQNLDIAHLIYGSYFTSRLSNHTMSKYPMKVHKDGKINREFGDCFRRWYVQKGEDSSRLFCVKSKAAACCDNLGKNC